MSSAVTASLKAAMRASMARFSAASGPAAPAGARRAQGELRSRIIHSTFRQRSCTTFRPAARARAAAASWRMPICSQSAGAPMAMAYKMLLAMK